MEREQWGRISDLFDAALARPASERHSYLQGACGGDDPLFHQVLGLLSELDRAGDFLEQPLFSLGQAFSIGALIANRYRVEVLLGRGGMGEVYRAHDELIGEKVALKTLRTNLVHDPEFLGRFRREVQLARKVTHASVCRVFEAGVHAGNGAAPVHFFAMQLLEGETLAARVRRDGALRSDEALPIAVNLAEGLDAAHAVGIIHRDLKSSNVMLCGARAVIMDFGLARAALVEGVRPHADRSFTARSQVLGTIAYMSPEQLSGGAVTAASDIYSFGVLLFEIVTGRLPFNDPHIIRSAMERAKEGAPDVRAMAPELDAQWAAVIARCLQRDPAKRFPTAGRVTKHLQPRWRPPMAYWTRRRWLSTAVTAAAVAGGVAMVPAVLRSYGQNTLLPEGAELFLGPIENLTADGRLDALTELFRSQLAQSVRVNVIDAARVDEMLTRMGVADDAPIDPDKAREAAWRLNAPLSIYGTVARVGPDYVLNVQTEARGSRPDTPRAKTLRSFSASDPAALMRSVRDASLWIREVVGESADSIGSFDRLPADTTTSSWEALMYFARGQRFYMRNEWDQATLEFEAALREDADFTLAAMRRADILMSQNQQTSGIAQWRTAIGMLDRRAVTRAEELYGRGMFAFDSGDMEVAERYARTWSNEYPHDWRAPYFRALPLCLNGHGAQAVEILEELIDVVPDYGDLYVQLIACHLVLGQTTAARALVPMIRRLNANLPGRADLREAYVRYREGDCVGYLEVLRSVQQAGSRPAAVQALLHESLLLIDAGYLQQAATNVERFLSRGSWVETVPGEQSLRVAQAWAEMLDGQDAAAVRHARMALGAESGPLIVALTGTVFARCGARELANEALALTAPFQDVRAHQMARHRIRGELARASDDVVVALEEFRAAAALEPAIAHRQYLIEALPRGSSERLDLAMKAAEVPWQDLRPPAMHQLGSLRTVVEDLTAAGVSNQFVSEFARTSRELSSLI